MEALTKKIPARQPKAKTSKKLEAPQSYREGITNCTGEPSMDFCGKKNRHCDVGGFSIKKPSRTTYRLRRLVYRVHKRCRWIFEL